MLYRACTSAADKDNARLYNAFIVPLDTCLLNLAKELFKYAVMLLTKLPLI